jgi:hypothetical protein
MNVIESALHRQERPGCDIERVFAELAAIRDQLRRLHEQLEIVRHLQDC